MRVAAETLVDTVPDSLASGFPDEWTPVESGYARVISSPRPNSPAGSLTLTVRLVTKGEMFGSWRWKVSRGSGTVDEGYEASRDEAMRWAVHRGRSFWS